MTAGPGSSSSRGRPGLERRACWTSSARGLGRSCARAATRAKRRLRTVRSASCSTRQRTSVGSSGWLLERLARRPASYPRWRRSARTRGGRSTPPARGSASSPGWRRSWRPAGRGRPPDGRARRRAMARQRLGRAPRVPAAPAPAVTGQGGARPPTGRRRTRGEGAAGRDRVAARPADSAGTP